MEINLSLIKKVEHKYEDYEYAATEIEVEAQKHIKWNTNVRCKYINKESALCICICSYVCLATHFFWLSSLQKDGLLSKEEFIKNSIKYN